MSESFSTVPLSTVIPAYLYQEYAADPDLQAFWAALNGLQQGYVQWFNSTPLAVYTSPNITGPLLDWIGQGIYGIARPTLSTSSTTIIAGYNSLPYNSLPYNALQYTSSGTAMLASDDIYKRVMTWYLYRGDGQVFCLQWLKNRVSRFLNGVNGTDYAVLNLPPSITVSDGAFTIHVGTGAVPTAFTQLMASQLLPLPFQYTYTVTA